MTVTDREYARLRATVFAISLLAWLVLFRAALGPTAAGAGRPGGHPSASYCGAVAPLLLPRIIVTPTKQLPPGPPAAEAAPARAWVGNWALMLAAMMLPTLVPPLYHLHQSSFTRRRRRAMALFVAGYGATWLAAGAGLLAVQLLARQLPVGAYLLTAGAGLLALGWQVSPLKQHCLNQGHRHRPLEAFGWRADWDALHMGVEHGGWCTASCWALMLLPLLLAHGHFGAMVAVSLLMFCERLDPPARPAWRWRGFATALAYVRRQLSGARRRSGPVTPMLAQP